MRKFTLLEALGALAFITYPTIEKYVSKAIPWALGAYVGYRVGKWRSR